MIHDYLKTGIGKPPLPFAENYYVHYPKVAIGVWPPVFHTTAALWMIVFSRTHTALLLFVACQCALCATAIALLARRLIPPLAATAVGGMMILLPAFQDACGMMMVDIFLTLMQLWALFRMIEFFRSGSMKAAVLWGMVTALAMLTKGNANSLAICGVIMLLLTRRFSLLKCLPIYVATSIVIIFGLPWQFLSLRMFGNAVPMATFSFARSWAIFFGYTAILAERLSVPILVIAAAGLLTVLVPLFFERRLTQPSVDAVAAASLLLAILVFHCISPTPPDDRYMIPALPLLLLFAALGIRWLSTAVPVLNLLPKFAAATIVFFCLGWFARTTFAFSRKPEIGFDKTAASLSPARVTDEVVLICSDSFGEGAFITSMALDDPSRIEHVVLRGSKILSENPWFLGNYHPNFANSTELENYFEQTPVDAIVVDESRHLWEPDFALLTQTIQDNSSKWLLSLELNEIGDRRHIRLYRWNGADHSKLKRSVRVRMPFTLGRDLVLQK